jgi:hypothetical protein
MYINKTSHFHKQNISIPKTTFKYRTSTFHSNIYSPIPFPSAILFSFKTINFLFIDKGIYSKIRKMKERGILVLRLQVFKMMCSR